MLELVNLLAFAAPPVTVPVTFPIKFPLNSTELTLDHLFSAVPKLYVCVALGTIVLVAVSYKHLRAHET